MSARRSPQNSPSLTHITFFLKKGSKISVLGPPSLAKEVLHRHSEVGGRSRDLPPSQQITNFSSTSHYFLDLNSKNQREEASGHFAIH